MKSKFIIIATITYIIGIILGLYLKLSIVFLLCFISFIVVLFKYSKKIKIVSILIIIIIISFIYTNYRNYIFTSYDNFNEVTLEGKVINFEKENDYYKTYKIKVKVLNNKRIKNTCQYVLLKINNTSYNKNYNNIQLGDTISIKGEIQKPEVKRNYKGFDYKNYLKSRNIITVIKAKDVNIITRNSGINIYTIKTNIIEKMTEILSKDSSSICLALLLGYKIGITEEINTYFQDSNLMHMLSISGMHISYICVAINYVFIKFNKCNKRILTIIILIIYMLLAQGIPSVMRACIGNILFIISELVYRKSDTFTNLSISAFIILIINPFAIFNIGFIFSYTGTISIILFTNYIQKIFDLIQIKLSTRCKEKVPKEQNSIQIIVTKFWLYIKNLVIISIAANILIIPLSIYYFQSFSLTFILSNLLATPVLSFIIILSIFTLFLALFSKKLILLFANLLNILIDFFILIAKFCSTIKFSKVLICSPSLIELVLIYTIIFSIMFLYKRGILKISNLKKVIKKTILKEITVKIYILIIIAVLIFGCFRTYTANLNIYFIDVGQGDSTLLITPKNKKILIDGGGTKDTSYDIGKNTLLPYLLNRKVRNLDYIIISHFDFDHVRTVYLLL